MKENVVEPAQDKALTRGWLLVPYLSPTNISQGWVKSLDLIIPKQVFMKVKHYLQEWQYKLQVLH